MSFDSFFSAKCFSGNCFGTSSSSSREEDEVLVSDGQKEDGKPISVEAWVCRTHNLVVELRFLVSEEFNHR